MTDMRCEVAIIGGGTAGMAAFREARGQGRKTLIVEAERFGTTCARVGCMPSKALIAAARRAEAVRDAGAFGIGVEGPRIDGAAVLERVRSERDRFVGHVLEEVEEWPDEARLVGRARFLDAGTLEVATAEGPVTVRAERTVVATGARPVVPEPFHALGERLATTDTLFELRQLPRSMAVFGAGPVGMELALAFAALGVRVTLLDRDETIGPACDPAVSAAIGEAVARRVDLVTGLRSQSFETDAAGVAVDLETGAGSWRERHDLVLCAVGRRPDLADLSLEATGVPLEESGVPRFDPATLRCGEAPIFMAGDADGRAPILHEAVIDGRTAGRNAATFPSMTARPQPVRMEIVFSAPEIMVVGQGRADLAARETPFRTGRVDFSDQGRARLERRAEGVLAVHAEEVSGRIVGAEMVGPGAEHFAHLLAFAIAEGASVAELLERPFYHPCLEEGLRTALRDLAAALSVAPPCAPHSRDCGPGA